MLKICQPVVFGSRAMLAMHGRVEGVEIMEVKQARPRIEGARERALDIVDAARAGDEIAVTTTTGSDVPLTSRSGDRVRLERTVRQIIPSWLPGSMSPALERARRFLGRSTLRSGELYLIGDFQASGFPRDARDKLAMIARSGARVYLLPVVASRVPNHAIEDLDPELRPGPQGKGLEMRARIVNHADQPSDRLAVRARRADALIGGGDVSLQPDESRWASLPIDWRIASPGYFNAMTIPLLRGRDFTDADGPPAPPVMIISQATAKRFWGDADPIGRALHRAADPKTSFTVIGVAGDVRNTALNHESPMLYYPMSFRVWPLMDVVVRTEGAPQALLPAIRQKVHEIDADLALANTRTMDEWVANSAAQPRLNAFLLGAFSAVALLIAAIGIYGVLAYSVTQRTREIGLRMALGAQPGGVLRLIVGEGMQIALIGVCAGLLGGVALARAVASLVYGVPVRDPATFVSVAVLLSGVALVACAIPALRAARVDPMVALRHE